MQPALPVAKSKLPLRRVKVVDQMIESLRQDIVTGRLPHGERLPSEKELSDQFGVSQPTVREALRALETLGLVDVLHGSGTFVRGQGDYALASALQTLVQLNNVDIIEILSVRQVLGRFSIQLASSNADAEDLANIEACYGRFANMERITELTDVIALIVNFQKALSTASHSPLLQSLEAFLMVLITEVQVVSLEGRGVEFWRSRALEFQPYRLAIVKGLRSGDPAEALRAMDAYLEAQRALFERDDLHALNLSNPSLIAVVSNMVRQLKNVDGVSAG